MVTRDLGRQGVQPAEDHPGFAVSYERGRVLFDHLSGAVYIAPRQGMPNGISGQPGLLVPRTRPSVQLRHQFRLGLAHAQAQQVGKQRVISVPATLRIKRLDKQVGSLQVLENVLSMP